MAKQIFDRATPDLFAHEEPLFCQTTEGNLATSALSDADKTDSPLIELQISKSLLDKLTLVANDKKISRSQLIELVLQQHFIEQNGN